MNAKKIMGAVLVALLAAALFVGAGAAALAEGDNGTYFVYQNNLGADFEGTWTNGAASVVIDDGVILPVGEFVPGTYSKGKATITILAPTANYKLTASYNNIPYLVANGGTVYNGSNVKLAITSLNTTVGFTNVLATIPPAGSLNLSTTVSTAVNADLMAMLGNGGLNIDKTGTYKFQAIFNGSGLVAGVPADLLLDKNVFTFKVVDSDEATITASVDTVYAGGYVTITVLGTPGVEYIVNTTDFTIGTKQLLEITGPVSGNYTFKMPNTGKAVFSADVKTTVEDEAVMKFFYQEAGAPVKEVKDGEITLNVEAPVVTATVGAASYFIGEEIEISGTASSSMEFTFNISGTNIKEQALSADFTKGKKWEATLTIPATLNLDVGTYTIKVYDAAKNVVATAAVALKQPFISIIEAPEVVVQNTDAEFLINAESTTKVQAYVFGTNYFEVFDGKLADEDVKNEFEVVIGKAKTKNLSAGQYFAVFQHPMYNGIYNIFEEGENTGKIVLNTTATATTQPDKGDLLFNVYSRQTANAAQALCDALDTQNIDDMYVKYSFFIVGEDESFTISEIPTQVVKGDKIVISGVDTANAGKTVAVEMVSTAFAAVPKETVGSAAFIVVTTTVAKDGTWEVTLDTSDLNVDEYSLSVAIDSVTKKNVNIDVVAAADKPDTPDTPDVPDTPDTPDTPTEPETPGFGALAALAGLGAVAVLLLRRE